MPEGAQASEYECPECKAPVELDSIACPNCGVEFAQPEGEEPPAVESEPLGESSVGEPLRQKAVEDKPGPLEPPGDEDLLEKARAPGEASARPAVGAGKMARAPALGVGPLSRLGGLIGLFGVLLVLVGVAGAIVGANYDTWIRGAAESSVGGMQQAGILAMAAAAAVGAILFVRAVRTPRAS